MHPGNRCHDEVHNLDQVSHRHRIDPSRHSDRRSIENYVLLSAASVPALRPLVLSLARRSKNENQAPYFFGWRQTCSRTRIPTGYFLRDSATDTEAGTSFGPSETPREDPNCDLEMNAIVHGATTDVQTLTTDVLVRPPPPQNKDKTVIETTEIAVPSDTCLNEI